MAIQLKQRSVLPGFGLTMGFTLFYLSLLVLIPLWPGCSSSRPRSVGGSFGPR